MQPGIGNGANDTACYAGTIVLGEMFGRGFGYLCILDSDRPFNTAESLLGCWLLFLFVCDGTILLVAAATEVDAGDTLITVVA